MTTIIMKEDSDGVSIAYDSQVTSGCTARNSSISKVFRNGSLIIGVTGDMAFLNAVKFEKFDEVSADPERWAVTHFAPKLRDLAERVSVCKDSECDCVNYSVLVIAGDRTFIVDSFLQVSKCAESYNAIGSGSDFALGALRMDATPMEALEVAAHFDTNTGGDLHLTTAAELLWDPAETGVLL